jgi:hypothetical protein
MQIRLSGATIAAERNDRSSPDTTVGPPQHRTNLKRPIVGVQADKHVHARGLDRHLAVRVGVHELAWMTPSVNMN